MLRKPYAVITATGLLYLLSATGQEPSSVVRQGACPPGYQLSGDFCAPTPNARPAVERRGACPPGYELSGNYCVAARDARPALPRKGACPAGYSGAGEYCLKNK